MQTRYLIAGAIASALFVGACAQQEEPAPVIIAEPVYDKYGNVLDEGGCVGGATAGAANTCLPPPGERGGRDGSGTSGGNTPGAGTAAP